MSEDSQTVVPGWWPKLMGGFLFALLVPVGLAWGVPGGTTLRPWQLTGMGLFGGWLLLRRLRRLPPLASRRVSMRRWLAALVGSATLSWLAVALYARWSFRLNGLDYSIFDWMLASSSRGHFMWAPLCSCNHFLLHPSYWMLLLWPLHRLCNSSYLLQLVHVAVMLLALVPLWHLSHHYLATTWQRALLLALYLTHAWSGALLDYGFHIEVFYLPAGLTLAWGWVSRRQPLLILGVLGYLATKEDGALTLLAFAGTAGILEPHRRRTAGTLAVVSLSVFLCNRFGVQGWAANGHEPAAYLAYWGDFGSTLPGILGGMLQRPGLLLARLARAQWPQLLLAFAGLPLLAPLQLAAALPTLLLLSSSDVPMMWRMRLYYPAPALPFLYWGLLVGWARLQRHGRWRRDKQAAAIAWAALCCLLPLIGGGYARYSAPRLDIERELAELIVRLPLPQGPVCAQTSLHPHLPYSWDLRGLSDACLAEPGALALAHPATVPYPRTRAALEDLIAAQVGVQRGPTGLCWWVVPMTAP